MKTKNSRKKQEKLKDKNLIYKKTLKRIIKVIVIIIVSYNLIYGFNNLITSKDYMQVFNTTIFRKDSQILFINKAELNTLQKGDTIAFENSNTLRVRIISNIYTLNGEKYLVTKTDNGLYNDVEEKMAKDINGRVTTIVPVFSFFMDIIESRIFTVIIIVGEIFYFLFNKELQRRKKSRKKKKENYYVEQ